ncbi:MAG TPA: hypothetical protein VGR01_06585 [Burkholderiales bacterium]|nr:hypothetical protein [Burkholderiales bacterium]
MINSLYSATPLQTLDKRVEGEALFVFPFGKGRKIIGVFGQGSFYRVIDHIGNRPVRGRGFEPQGTVNLGLEIDGSAF